MVSKTEKITKIIGICFDNFKQLKGTNLDILSNNSKDLQKQTIIFKNNVHK